MKLDAGKILLTIAAIQYGFVPPIVDFTTSHVFHPDWPPHARFHMVWSLAVCSSLALYVIASVWMRAEREAARLRHVSVIGCVILLGFFTAALFRSAYGGSLSDAAEPIRILGIDGNVFSFGVALILQVLGSWRVWFQAAAA